MPYEISFEKIVQPRDPEGYINECCFGGDLVAEQLIPALRRRVDVGEPGEEDWGWFLWFKEGKVRLALDIFCDDPATGAFRIHLTSRRRRWLLNDAIVDVSELEELRAMIVADLASWTGSPVHVTWLDAAHMPVST